MSQIKATLTFLVHKNGERGIAANGLDLFWLSPVEGTTGTVLVESRLPGRIKSSYTVTFDVAEVWKRARESCAADWQRWLAGTTGADVTVTAQLG